MGKLLRKRRLTSPLDGCTRRTCPNSQAAQCGFFKVRALHPLLVSCDLMLTPRLSIRPQWDDEVDQGGGAGARGLGGYGGGGCGAVGGTCRCLSVWPSCRRTEPDQSYAPSRLADCYKCRQPGHWANDCPNEGGTGGGGGRSGYASNARGGSSSGRGARGGSSTRGGSTRGRGWGSSLTRGGAIAKRATAAPRAKKEFKPKVERAVKPLAVKKEVKPKVKAETKPRVKAER